MKSLKKIWVSVIALGGIIGSAEAGVVKTTQTELSTPAGAEKVYERIYEAAKIDCDVQFVSPYAVKTKMRYERCLRGSVKHMVRELAHPNIDAAFADAANRTLLKVKPVQLARRTP